MRIAIISYNDNLGGAAIASLRLMRALRQAGHDAYMLVFHKYGSDPDVHRMGDPLSRSFVFLAERLQIFTRNGFNRPDLFKVSTGRFGLSVHTHPLIQSADAIFLGWINQGMLSLNEIRRLASLGKPILWTMHDMWCFTGICHYAFSCQRYENGCGLCKFLHSAASPSDLSSRVWQKKLDILRPLPIKYVAVSSWVKNKALLSPIMNGKEIAVIPNPLWISQLPEAPEKPADKFRIVFGAANLLVPIKRLDLAIASLNILAERHPELSDRVEAIFYGAMASTEPFSVLKTPYKYLGLIDPSRLPEIFSKANVVLSTAEFETLGGTLVEGMAYGAVPVTYGEGGQPDFVHHLRNGYVADYLSPSSTADGIYWALTAAPSAASIIASLSPMLPASVAARHLALFNQG